MLQGPYDKLIRYDFILRIQYLFVIKDKGPTPFNITEPVKESMIIGILICRLPSVSSVDLNTLDQVY